MAAGAQGIRAGRAYVEAGWNDAGLRAGLKAAEAKLKALGASVAGIGAKLGAAGATITTPFLAAAKLFADTGSELNDMSARTGVSVEALSALGHAAGQTGSNLGDVETAVRKMQKTIASAAGGSIEAQVALGKLGLSAERLAGMKPEDQFAVISRRIAQIKDPTLKAAAAMELMGKSATAILPMIDDLDALTKEAKDFGLVMSKEDAAAADKLGDAMDLLGAVIKRTTEGIGAALAPALTDAAIWLARTTKLSMDWVKQNKPLVVLVFKVGVALVAAGAAFVALGAAISGTGVVLGGIATAIGAISTVLGVILSPLGLVTIGLVAGGAAFVKYTNAGQQALGWLTARFKDFKADAMAALGGITDALSAGDLPLASRILWAALKVEWLKGTLALDEIWAKFGVKFVNSFRGISFNLASHFVNATAGIRSSWAVMVSDLTGSWGPAIARLIKTFIPLFDVVEKFTHQDFAKAIDDALKAVGVAQPDQVAHQKALADTLAGIERDRVVGQASVNDQEKADAENRRKAAQDAIDKAMADLKAAQGEFKGLRDRAAAGAGGLPKIPGKKPHEVAEMLDGLDQAAAKVDVKGTFSGAALRGLGIGDTASDQLKESQKQTKQLERINERLRRAGPQLANEP